jgi:ubiquinone/menaquinone biosynthesis C-methylase UbiE
MLFVRGAGAKLAATTTTTTKTSFSSSRLPRGRGGVRAFLLFSSSPSNQNFNQVGEKRAVSERGRLAVGRLRADDGKNSSGVSSGRGRERKKEDDAVEASKDDNDNDNAWEQFYRNHKTKFFRDRHYLRKSFKRDLMNDVEFTGFVEDATEEEMEEKLRALPKLDVLEIGAGVGNALFPLLRANPNLRFSAADVSETAIKQLKMHEDYDEKKIVRAFVVNAGERGCLGNGREGVERVGGKGQVSIKDESFDVVLMCFFLSALTDEEISNCLMEVRRVLKQGGVALVRDYADDDVKNDLSDYHPGRELVMEEELNVYQRNDGTLARFFSEKQMMHMFAKVGFQNAINGTKEGGGEEQEEEKKKGSAVERVLFTQTNRKKNIEIKRAFLEGRFVK